MQLNQRFIAHAGWNNYGRPTKYQAFYNLKRLKWRMTLAVVNAFMQLRKEAWKNGVWTML